MRDGAGNHQEVGRLPRYSKGWMFHVSLSRRPDEPSCSLRDDGLLTCFGRSGCDRADVGRALDALGFTDDGTRTTFEPEGIDARIKKAQELWNEAPFDAEVILHYFGRRRISRPDVPPCIRCYLLNGIMAAVQQLDGTIAPPSIRRNYTARASRTVGLGTGRCGWQHR